MLIENVSIKNVPSNVIAVNVTISPLYENLLLNGNYEGTDGSQTIDLIKEVTETHGKTIIMRIFLKLADRQQLRFH